MSFARWVFRIAGIYGVVAIAPLFFLEEWTGRAMPPTINHPEYFYGFAGVTLAWQIAFLVISLDPVRYRLLIIPAMVEKFAFVIASAVLLWQQRLPLPLLGGAILDLVLGVLFVAAFFACRPQLPNSLHFPGAHMTNLRNPKLLCLKGVLFLLTGLLAGGILLAQHFDWKSAVLLGLTIWAFCRAYYFAFYVIEKYIDPSYKFSGLSSAAWFACRQFFGTSTGNRRGNIR